MAISLERRQETKLVSAVGVEGEILDAPRVRIPREGPVRKANKNKATEHAFLGGHGL